MGIPQEGLWLREEAFAAIVLRGGQYSLDDLIFGQLDWLEAGREALPSLANLRLLLKARLRR